MKLKSHSRIHSHLLVRLREKGNIQVKWEAYNKPIIWNILGYLDEDTLFVIFYRKVKKSCASFAIYF